MSRAGEEVGGGPFNNFLTRSNPILSNEGGGQAQRRRLDTEDKLRGCTLRMSTEVPAIRWVSVGADREGECREATDDAVWEDTMSGPLAEDGQGSICRAWTRGGSRGPSVNEWVGASGGSNG